jgi:hypothetical protein
MSNSRAKRVRRKRDDFGDNEERLSDGRRFAIYPSASFHFIVLPCFKEKTYHPK